MKLDDTIKEIIEQIIIDVKNKYGITFSIEEIYSCIDSQIEATKIAFVKGISIHWIKLGKFIFTERNKRGKIYKQYEEDLNDENTDLTTKEKEQKLKEFRIVQAIEKKTITNIRKIEKQSSLDDINNFGNSETKKELPILQIISKPKIELKIEKQDE